LKQIGNLIVLSESAIGQLKKSDITNDNIFWKPNGWVPQISACCHLTIDAKTAAESSLVIMPSTFNPGTEKSFEITVFCDCKIKLSQIKEANPSSESDDDGKTED